MKLADERSERQVLSPLQVEAITSRARLEEIRPQWLDLLATSPGAVGFNAPAAVLAWYRHVERYSRIHVAGIWRGDELVGLAPFSVVRAGPFTLYSSAGAGYGFYGGPLLGPSAEAVAQALAVHIGRLVRSGLASVYLRRMPVEHELFGALDRDGGVEWTAMGPDENNCVVDFSLMPDPEEYFTRVSRKHSVPRRTRRLTEHVDSLEMVAEDPDPDAGLDAMREMIVRRFGEDLRIFRGPHNRTLTRELVHGLIADGQANVSSVMADGRRAAVTIDLQVGTSVFCQAVAYEPDLYNYSIGHIELFSFLRRAHSSGITHVDLGSSGFNYKRRWANSESCFRTVAVTAPGRLGALANHFRRATIAYHRGLLKARNSGLPVV